MSNEMSNERERSRRRFATLQLADFFEQRRDEEIESSHLHLLRRERTAEREENRDSMMSSQQH